MAKFDLRLNDVDDLKRIITEIAHEVEGLTAEDAFPAVSKRLKALGDVVDEFKRKRVMPGPGTASVELPVTKADFARGGLKMLHDVCHPAEKRDNDSNVFERRYKFTESLFSKWSREWDKAFITAALVNKTGNPTREHIFGLKYYRDVVQPLHEEVMSLLKDTGAPLNITDAGEGNEWIPVGMSGVLLPLVELELPLMTYFTTFDMPTNPYRVPIQIGRPQAYRIKGLGGVTADPTTTERIRDSRLSRSGSVISMTDDQTFTAKALAARITVEKFITEDSIIPILPFAQTQLVLALSHAREQAFLDGDTAKTMDYDTSQLSAVDELPEAQFDGARKYALALTGTSKPIVSASGGKLDDSAVWKDTIPAVRAKMAAWGVNPLDLLLVHGPTVGIQQIPYNPDFRTAYQVAAALSSITNSTPGRAPCDGLTPVLSQYVREDVASTGKNINGGPNDKTYALIVNRRAWWVGRWRGVTLEVLNELFALEDAIALKVSTRYAMRSPYADNTYHTGIVHDIGL